MGVAICCFVFYLFLLLFFHVRTEVLRRNATADAVGFTHDTAGDYMFKDCQIFAL